MKYLIENINQYNINQLDYLKNTIHKKKLDQINSISNVRYRTQKIIGELLLIDGLKKLFNVDYDSLSFGINNNGKPYILNNTHHIYYNISHSFDYCICGFSNNKIGVDIEKIRKTDLKVINQFATLKEKEYILEIKEKYFERLFEIYTLKEAYFKMKGENLSNIKSVEFSINNDKITCSDHQVKVDIKRHIDGYIIAFCEEL